MDATKAVTKNTRHGETTDNAMRFVPSASTIRTGVDGPAVMRTNAIIVTGTKIGVGKEMAAIEHCGAHQIDTTTEHNTGVLVARTDALGGQQKKA